MSNYLKGVTVTPSGNRTTTILDWENANNQDAKEYYLALKENEEIKIKNLQNELANNIRNATGLFALKYVSPILTSLHPTVLIPGLLGHIGGKATDEMIESHSKGKYNSWGQMLSDKTGIDSKPGKLLLELTNPGSVVLAGGSLFGKSIKGLNHIGKYYLNPRYNNRSYIRQVGDDAIADMLKTKKLRSSALIELEEKAYNEAIADILGYDPKGLSELNFGKTSPRLTLHKTFSDLMFYTGRPFYGKIRTNYLVTEPKPVISAKNLFNKGLEWVESNHKNHTNAAKVSALKRGMNPDTAPGRIVVPLFNGNKNNIPLSEFGKLDLYQPVDLLGIKLPIYKRTKFNYYE